MSMATWPDLAAFSATVLSHPEVFATKSDDVSRIILETTKQLFDFAKTTEPKSLCKLPELITEGFYPEQIWEELQLKNIPTLNYIEQESQKFGKRRITLVSERPVKKAQVERSFEIHSEDESSESSEVGGDFESDQEEGSDADLLGDDDDDMLGGLDDDDDEKDEEEELSDDEDDMDDMDGLRLMDADEDEEEVMEEDDFVSDEDEQAAAVAEDSTAELSDESRDDQRDVDAVSMSAHRKRQRQLESQIAELENRALGKKDWQVTAKQRPKDSLLEATVEFDVANRPAPLVTESLTTDIEAMICGRIKEGRYDDVQRKAEAKTSVKKRVVTELDDQKSKKGLAEIYEEEYLQKAMAAPVEDKVKKQHAAITAQFKKICYYLDSLSNYHFTPKPSIPDLEVRVNVPAVAMEEAIPVGVSNATLLAPSEVYKPEQRETKGETEVSREERKARRRERKTRGKKIKAKQAEEKKLIEQLRPGKKPSKAEAEKQLKIDKSNIIEARRSAGALGEGNVWKKLQEGGGEQKPRKQEASTKGTVSRL